MCSYFATRHLLFVYCSTKLFQITHVLSSFVCEFVEMIDGIDASYAGLRPGISEHDFILVPEAAWEVLHGWYGGGPQIRRHARSLEPRRLYVSCYLAEKSVSVAAS